MIRRRWIERVGRYLLLAWVVGGAVYYYVHFTVLFWHEHAAELRALVGK